MASLFTQSCRNKRWLRVNCLPRVTRLVGLRDRSPRARVCVYCTLLNPGLASSRGETVTGTNDATPPRALCLPQGRPSLAMSGGALPVWGDREGVPSARLEGFPHPQSLRPGPAPRVKEGSSATRGSPGTSPVCGLGAAPRGMRQPPRGGRYSQTDRPTGSEPCPATAWRVSSGLGRATRPSRASLSAL